MKSQKTHIANQVLTKLDQSAARLEKLASEGKMDPKLASKLILELDGFSDRFHVAAFGEESLRRHQAKVLECGPQDKVIKGLGNPNGVLESESDEPYMKEFNTDMTSQVQELVAKTWPKTASTRTAPAKTWSK